MCVISGAKGQPCFSAKAGSQQMRRAETRLSPKGGTAIGMYSRSAPAVDGRQCEA